MAGEIFREESGAGSGSAEVAACDAGSTAWTRSAVSKMAGVMVANDQA